MFSWLVMAGVVGYFGYYQLPLVVWAVILVLIGLSGLFSLLAINSSQQEVAESKKEHSRTKRHVQELQLKIDRHAYNEKKSSQLRRIVLNSTQEKDHFLRNVASALDVSMDDILSACQTNEEDLIEQVNTRASSMKRYASDLQALAQLELKSELPEPVETNFLIELGRLVDDWSNFGKSRKVKVKLDNPEDQITLHSDINWIENLLSRLVYALIRMNTEATLFVRVIGYTDAQIGDSLRLSLSIAGRQFSEVQLKHVMTEFISILDDGHEVGPGLTFVVSRRIAQMLNGIVEVQNTSDGVEVLVVIPRHSVVDEDEDGVAF